VEKEAPYDYGTADDAEEEQKQNSNSRRAKFVFDLMFLAYKELINPPGND
jgi:hypothetical protein